MVAPLRVYGPKHARANAVRASIDHAQPLLDGYFQRLFKLIPAEVIAVYPAIAGLIPDTDTTWIVTWPCVCVVILLFIRILGTRAPEVQQGPQWIAIVVSIVSFLIWLYTLDGVLVKTVFGEFHSYRGFIAVVGWTFFVPYFYRA